mmetsp:Transcript_11061/g.23046  ORF Transcript_11061/g.23046 Transcript_11061/m.23046 type:complete len:273 (-) Transcript_11061:636-1454(-)
MGVEAHGLVDAAHQIRHPPHVLVRRQLLVRQHAVHLLEHLLQLVAVGGEEVGGPGEHGPRGLVPGHQHAEEVVAQLLLRHLLAGGEQEAQHGGVLLVAVVLSKVARAVDVHLLRHNRLALLNQLLRGRANHLHGLVRALLPGEEQAQRVGQLPDRQQVRGALLRLLERGVHRLDDGGVLVEGGEVVVEDGQPDDVQRQLREVALHVKRLTRLRKHLQLPVELQSRLPEHAASHGLQEALVQRGPHSPPPHFPQLPLRRGEPVPEQELGNLVN